MKNIGIIGYGAIGRSIATQLTGGKTGGLRLVGVMGRAPALRDARATLPENVCCTDDLAKLLDQEPDIVIEAAGQAAVEAYAVDVMASGADFHVLSVGAFADRRIEGRLYSAAALGRGRIVLPAGALGGFDALMSLAAGGLDTVTYVSTKPPAAWADTEAEQAFDLAALQEATVLLDADAREAARRFPRNANLAAAVALAGLGFDRTRIKLIADPAVTTNIGQVVAHGALGRLDVTLEGAGEPSNPKTSEVTAYSVIAGLRNAIAPVSFL